MGISNKLLTFHKELKKHVTVKEFRVKICVSVLQQQFLKQLLKKKKLVMLCNFYVLVTNKIKSNLDTRFKITAQIRNVRCFKMPVQQDLILERLWFCSQKKYWFHGGKLGLQFVYFVICVSTCRQTCILGYVNQIKISIYCQIIMKTGLFRLYVCWF